MAPGSAKKAGASFGSFGDLQEALLSRGGILGKRWVTSFGMLLTRVCGGRQGRGRGGSAFFGRGVRRRLGVSRRWRGRFLGSGTRGPFRRFRIRSLRLDIFRCLGLGSGLSIIGRVPPCALELESRRRNQSFDGSPAGGACAKRTVRELLKPLEAAALLTVVFVKWHGYYLFLGKTTGKLSIAAPTALSARSILPPPPPT